MQLLHVIIKFCQIFLHYSYHTVTVLSVFICNALIRLCSAYCQSAFDHKKKWMSLAGNHLILHFYVSSQAHRCETRYFLLITKGWTKYNNNSLMINPTFVWFGGHFCLYYWYGTIETWQEMKGEGEEEWRAMWWSSTGVAATTCSASSPPGRRWNAKCLVRSCETDDSILGAF